MTFLCILCFYFKKFNSGIKKPPQYVRVNNTIVAIRLALKLRSEFISEVPKLMKSTAMNSI
jgi:hypothetical protein